MTPCKNFFVFLCAGVLVFALISGCNRTAPAVSQEQSAQQKRITIGFSLDSLVVERWIRDRDVFVSTANSLGADVIFQNAANSETVQLTQVRYLIDRGVDVLVIIPKNADSFTDVIQRASSRGVKVISYDRLIRNAGVDLYITVDSVAVGRLMAEQIVQKVPSGNYVFIHGPLEDHNVTLMKAGQRSVFGNYPGIFSILNYYAENWSYDRAYEQVTRLLDRGIRIDAIVCGNDGLAGGAIRALAVRRLAGKIPVVGQDADIMACQYIVEGSQLATVFKPITALARQAAVFAVALAQGREIEGTERIYDGRVEVPVYWLEPQAVNRANIDSVIIASGFHTKEEVYRLLPGR